MAAVSRAAHPVPVLSILLPVLEGLHRLLWPKLRLLERVDILQKVWRRVPGPHPQRQVVCAAAITVRRLRSPEQISANSRNTKRRLISSNT